MDEAIRMRVKSVCVFVCGKIEDFDVKVGVH